MVLYSATPLGIGRVLDEGTRIYRATFRPLLPVSLAAAVLLGLPQLVSAWDSGMREAAISVLLLLVIGAPTYAAMLAAQDRLARGEAPLALGATFGIALPRAATLVLIGPIALAAIAVGMVLLVVPGLILSVTLAFAGCAVILEGRGPFGALRRSHELVWGQWWRTLAVLSVAMVLSSLPSMLIGGVIGFLAARHGGGGQPPSDAVMRGYALAALPLQIAVLVPTLPLINAMCLAQFHDLRLRRDGTDLIARSRV